MLSLYHMTKTTIKTKIQSKIMDFGINSSDSIPKISVREYMRNFKVYNQKVADGATFIIAKNDEEQVMLSTPPEKNKKKFTLKDWLTLDIPKDIDIDPYVSENIDKIAYGL
jgi:hypothetical protein